MTDASDLPEQLPEFGEVSTQFFIDNVRYFLLGARGEAWTIKRGSLADEVGQILRHGDGWAIAIYEKDLVEKGKDWRDLILRFL